MNLEVRQMRKILLSLIVVALLVPLAGATGPEAAFDVKYNNVLSRLQSMGHGYYSDKEWAEVEESVNDLLADAARRSDGEAIVKAAVIKAMVLSDMRRRHPEAMQVLAHARQQVAKLAGVDASRLYVKEAEIQAEAGNPDGVAAVIRDYKASQYYDPKPYGWSGGTGPGDPLVLARPGTTDKDSLPLTVMEKARVRARSAPGITFPDATLTDIHGRSFTLSSLRGKVVLVDFFARGWRVWEETLPQIRDTWARYNPLGFEIVSICLERNPAGLESLGLPWPVVAGAPALTRPLGIFGSSTSYLLDANGMVIARDLRGQDLAFAVRRALGR
jgi:hypothetical protein